MWLLYMAIYNRAMVLQFTQMEGANHQVFGIRLRNSMLVYLHSYRL